tara:strand:- start:2326 stop:2907 length:582 start_codon:yes stop_codon:yes gene_type:complete
MKKQILTVIISMIATISLVGFTANIIKPKLQIVTELESRPIQPIEIKLEPVSIEINETEMFLNAIGQRESSNRYTVVNKWGYMGKYQFGKRTLKSLGYNVSRKEFLNSPHLQEMAMLDLLLHNKKSLQSYIDKHEGIVVNGTKITESGILAAAHLAGSGNVRRYFKKGKQFKDGNGTKLTSYLTQFSGYKLNL